MEEDDEVVEEFDVILSPVDKFLTLFQYPLRTIDRPYGDEGKLSKVTVKTLNNKISMQYDLNKENDNYDKNASNHRISSHKLSSTYIPTQTSYCVGTFKDDALFLSPIDLIYQMRPDFEHVNAEAMERMVGGPDINLQRSKKTKDTARMQIVDDGTREEQRKELELQNEKEHSLLINDNQEKLLNLMTSVPESSSEESELYVLKSGLYMPRILPNSESQDYQAKITEDREGKISMEKLLTSPYQEFLAFLMIHCKVIGINKLKTLMSIYCTKNNHRINGKTADEITNQDVAREIIEIAYVFRNGFIVLKSIEGFINDCPVYLRNHILFTLFDNSITFTHPSVRNEDFYAYGSPKDIRDILFDLCENRAGKWFFKNHEDETLFDLYTQFDDQNLLDTIINDIENAKEDTNRHFKNIHK